MGATTARYSPRSRTFPLTSLNGLGGHSRFRIPARPLVLGIFSQGLRPLGLARSNNLRENAPREQNAAHCGGKFLAMFGLNADLGVTDLYSVVLAVRDRYDKGQHSEHQQQHTNPSKG